MMSFDCSDNWNGAIRLSATTNLTVASTDWSMKDKARQLLSLSQAVYSITAKGRAALHEAEGND
jgi:hypothetical protein